MTTYRIPLYRDRPPPAMIAALTRLLKNIHFYLLCLIVVSLPTWSCFYLAFVFKVNDFDPLYEGLFVLGYVVMVFIWFHVVVETMATVSSRSFLTHMHLMRVMCVSTLAAVTVIGFVHTQNLYKGNPAEDRPMDSDLFAYTYTTGYAVTQGIFAGLFMTMLPIIESMPTVEETTSNIFDTIIWMIIAGVCTWFGANGVSDDRTGMTETMYLSAFIAVGVITLLMTTELISNMRPNLYKNIGVCMMFLASTYTVVVSALLDPHEYRIEVFVTSIVMSSILVITSFSWLMASSCWYEKPKTHPLICEA